MRNLKSYYQAVASILNRRTLVFSFLLFLFTIAQGKDFSTSPMNKRILSYNPGFSFSGSGDGFGIGSELSHLKTITPWLYHKETLSSWIVNGESWIESATDNQTGMDFSIELGIAPFQSNKRSLSFTGGICLGAINSIIPSGGGSYSNGSNNAYFQHFRNSYEKQLDTGFTVGANYHYFVSSRLSLNMRAAFRGYSKTGNAISILSVGVGYKIN